MQSHESTNPLEGKWKEMIPDRGNPFDDFEE